MYQQIASLSQSRMRRGVAVVENRLKPCQPLESAAVATPIPEESCPFVECVVRASQTFCARQKINRSNRTGPKKHGGRGDYVQTGFCKHHFCARHVHSISHEQYPTNAILPQHPCGKKRVFCGIFRRSFDPFDGGDEIVAQGAGHRISFRCPGAIHHSVTP